MGLDGRTDNRKERVDGLPIQRLEINGILQKRVIVNGIVMGFMNCLIQLDVNLN